MNIPITFEIAKLLNVKGFKEKTHLYYTFEGKLENENSFITQPAKKCSAPAITKVVMWLYEKHGIWISVLSSDDITMFSYKIYSNQGSYYGPDFNSPKVAYETAIEYTLKNLI